MTDQAKNALLLTCPTRSVELLPHNSGNTALFHFIIYSIYHIYTEMSTFFYHYLTYKRCLVKKRKIHISEINC